MISLKGIVGSKAREKGNRENGRKITLRYYNPGIFQKLDEKIIPETTRRQKEQESQVQLDKAIKDGKFIRLDRASKPMP